MTRCCLSSLMSRFRRVWWVAFVELDDSSRQVSVISKKSKLIAFVISKKIESNSWNINDEMIKHNHENKFTEILSAKRKIWNRIFRLHFTFQDKTQQDTLLTSSQHVIFFERTFSVVAKKRNYQEQKQFIIVMFSKKKFQNKTFIFIYYRLLF